jgi:hypothetical protein
LGYRGRGLGLSIDCVESVFLGIGNEIKNVAVRVVWVIVDGLGFGIEGFRVMVTTRPEPLSFRANTGKIWLLYHSNFFRLFQCKN